MITSQTGKLESQCLSPFAAAKRVKAWGGSSGLTGEVIGQDRKGRSFLLPTYSKDRNVACKD